MAPQFKTPVARRVQAQSAVTPYTIASPSLRGGHTHSSPSLISPSVTMSTVTIPINDDAAERRQRRLDTRTHAAASPGCHTPTMSTTTDRCVCVCVFMYVCVCVCVMLFHLLLVGGLLRRARTRSPMPRYRNITPCVWNYRLRMWELYIMLLICLEIYNYI